MQSGTMSLRWYFNEFTSTVHSFNDLMCIVRSNAEVPGCSQRASITRLDHMVFCFITHDTEITNSGCEACEKLTVDHTPTFWLFIASNLN